jgi:hypothetical protein
MSELKFSIPTETIELPSKGVLYPKESPLSSGFVEMKYMTAKEEDIITNQNYINKGVVLDKLIESMLVEKLDLDDMLLGDKNALLISTRILGYGKDYTFKTIVDGEIAEKSIDLSTLDEKPLLQETQVEKGRNEFRFELPMTKTSITFKLLTHKDEKNINKEIEGIKKLFPNGTTPEISTRMKYIITSVDGHSDTKTIREFVDKGGLIASDSRALRKEYKRIAPDVNLTYKNDGQEDVNIPINLNFFYPE